MDGNNIRPFTLLVRSLQSFTRSDLLGNHLVHFTLVPVEPGAELFLLALDGRQLTLDFLSRALSIHRAAVQFLHLGAVLNQHPIPFCYLLGLLAEVLLVLGQISRPPGDDLIHGLVLQAGLRRRSRSSSRGTKANSASGGGCACCACCTGGS